MHVSNQSNPQSAIAMQVLQQSLQQQQQLAETTIKMSQAQENAQRGEAVLGTAGSLVDVYA